MNRKVRQYGSWGLMPFAAAIGSVYPASYMRGHRETYHPMETNWPRCAALFTIKLDTSSPGKPASFREVPDRSRVGPPAGQRACIWLKLSWPRSSVQASEIKRGHMLVP